MSIKNTGSVLDGFARDGRVFGHVIENLRDAVLNEAANVEFRIQGLNPDKPCVARRVIADDGSGMTKDVLENVYAYFSATGTSQDFVVDANDDGTIDVSIEPTVGTDGYHARRGFGGRASLSTWNPFGVATVTVHNGVAKMVWIYRSFDGESEMREWIEDGVKRNIIAPYTEPEFLTYTDLMADRSFAKLLFVTSKFCADEESAEIALNAMDYDEVFPNPLFGVQWDGDVVPKWIIDHYGEDGLAYRKDGSLAHGTVKVLMGKSPYDSTAVAGDPNFIAEADFKKYNGAANRFWLDLTPWNVTVWAIMSPPRAGRTPYTLIGYDKPYGLDSGDTRESMASVPSGRRQLGALGLRRDPYAAVSKPVEYSAMLDLGEYGKALLLLRTGVDDSGKEFGTSSDDLYGSSRKGVVCAVYGNEVHGIASDVIDTPDYVFLNMGIPMTEKSRGRVSLFLFLPRRTETSDGVFQAAARDRLKWSGTTDGGLPLTGDHGINQAVARALPTEFHKLVTDEDSGVKIKYDPKRVKNLFAKAKDMAKAGKDAIATTLKSKSNPDTDDHTLIEDGSVEAVHSGVDAGPQGKPGDTERPVCAECGLKVHAADCSLKPKATVGGKGGTAPKFRKLVPSATGTQLGRTSKAKAPTLIPPTSDDIDIDPEPPVINIDNVAPYGDKNPEWPVSYVRPAEFFPKTGTLTVNREHVVVQRLIGLALGAGRDKAATRVETENWIKLRLTDALFGILTMHGERFVAGDPSAKDVNDLVDDVLSKPETWLMILSTLYFNEASLRAYITAHVAVAVKGAKAA